MAKEAQMRPQSFAQLQEAFRPYTHSHQRAKDIRKSLVKYLQNLLTLSDEKHKLYGSLPDPKHVVSVKPASKEVAGSHKRYLESLEAFLTARTTVDETGASLSEQASLDTTADPGTENILEEYLQLLHEREHLQKLQILQHYLNELVTMQASKEDFQEFPPLPRPAATLKSQPEDVSANGYAARGMEAGESLTEKLELTVLKAKSQMELQQKLLEELKARKADSSFALEREARLEGLAKSRDNLHSWVQEKLTSSDLGQYENGDDDESAVTNANAKSGELDIKAQYSRYCETRKRLIESASALDEPSATGNFPIAKTQPLGYRSPASSPRFSPLPFLTRRLFRANELEKQLGDQTRFCSEILGREKSSIDETLRKLRDESHLLPSYPILANQERFQDASNAFRRGKSEDDEHHSTDGDIQEYVKAWNFAASASTIALEGFLQGHFDRAKSALDTAEEGLASLQDQTGRRPQADSNDGVEGEDIWTAEIDAGVSNLDESGSRDDRGPWAGLNGRIGIS